MSSVEHKREMRETHDAQVRSYGISRNIDILMKTAPLPKSKNYRKVQPRLLNKTSKEDLLSRKLEYNEIKNQREVEGCTFQPKLNNNSLAMARNNPKPPIGMRGVPDRYKRSLVEEKKRNLNTQRLEQEASTMKIPDTTGKSPDDEFYGQKVAWRTAADEKIESARKAKEDEEIGTFIGKPTLNDYTNNKIVSADKLDNDEFLVRVDKTIQRKKENLERLTDEVYNFPFQPALYKPRRGGEINVQN